MKTEIRVTGIENKGKKMNILDNKTKYNFWITKQDGTDTKANLGFQKIRPIVGDTLIAEVESKEASFVNAEGKTVNYTDNQILYFYTDGEQMQNAQAPMPIVRNELPTISIEELEAPANETNAAVLLNRVMALESRVKNLEDAGVNIDEIPFN